MILLFDNDSGAACSTSLAMALVTALMVGWTKQSVPCSQCSCLSSILLDFFSCLPQAKKKLPCGICKMRRVENIDPIDPAAAVTMISVSDMAM